MNREIEFRAWLKKEKRMIDVLSIEFDAKLIVFYKQDEEYEDVIRTTFAPFDQIELIQYTGIKDKNGVEIYEGDILKHFKGNIYIVEFHNGAFKLLRYNPYKGIPIAYYSFNTFYDMGNMNELEVIGNIYENPELLEKK